MTIRIIEDHRRANDWPPDEYKTTYLPMIPNCFNYKESRGIRFLMRGKHDVFIEYFLSPAFTEMAYIQLISKETREVVARMYDGSLMAWGTIHYVLDSELRMPTFYTHYYKDGHIFHEQKKPDKNGLVGKNGWKAIHEWPEKNSVYIVSSDINGVIKRLEMPRNYSEESMEDWLAIFNAGQKKSAEPDPWLTILTKSFRHTA
jgi:hypothetical protein